MAAHDRVLLGERLSEIKPRLQAVFHDRLRGVLLFGSEPRGEAGEDSDVDLLVLLEGPVQLGRDLERIVGALYPLQMELERPIHALPVPVDTFEAGEYALYREARREGVAL